PLSSLHPSSASWALDSSKGFQEPLAFRHKSHSSRRPVSHLIPVKLVGFYISVTSSQTGKDLQFLCRTWRALAKASALYRKSSTWGQRWSHCSCMVTTAPKSLTSCDCARHGCSAQNLSRGGKWRRWWLTLTMRDRRLCTEARSRAGPR